MDGYAGNKRLKSATGAPIKTSSGAANLPAYVPPTAPAIGARGANGPSSARPSASIARPANGKTSLRLTVKAPPSKLRQATSGSASIPPNPYADAHSESDATPQPAGRTARATRNPRTVVEPDSDDDEDEDEDEDADADAEGENEELEDEEMEDAELEIEANEVSGEDEDAEGEEEDDEEDEEEDDEDEDEEMDDHPPPPVITQTRPSGKSKPNVTVTAPQEGPMKSVEDKELDDEEGEELSELDSNENGEDEEEDDDSDEDDESGSRSATPDLTKLTRRQRGYFEEQENSLLSLSNEAQKKKHLTAEEHAMRRAEMARRRKNLSEKRNEEEKMDTINKLLKKPAPKRRTRAEIIAQQHADAMATPGAEDGEEERPDPLFVRWVSGREGSRLGVPEEWLEAPVGEVYGGPSERMGARRMVEEVA